jgi:hypothetical protein
MYAIRRTQRYRRNVQDASEPCEQSEPSFEDASVLLLAAVRASAHAATHSIERASTHPAGSMARREAVRHARKELKAVRALAALCRSGSGATADAAIEFAAKTNQILGPLRDRDALHRSIVRISERFAESDSRRVVRAVLLATLVVGDFDREDESHYSDLAIARARRTMRAALDAVERLGANPAATHLDARDDKSDRGERVLLREFAACREELADTLATASDAADLARLHDCRKRASFLAITLRAFGERAPQPIVRVRVRAKRLASALGEDRDLALLDAEMTRARSQLAGSPLVDAIDSALRLARLEATARMEDAARAFLRVRRAPVRKALQCAFGRD